MVYELPPALNIDPQPFLEVVGQIQAELAKTLSWSLHTEDREILEAAGKMLEGSMAEYQKVVPAAISEAMTEYEQIKRDFVQLQVDQAAHAKRAEEVLAEMRADIEKSKLAAAAEKAKPKFVPLKPRRATPAKKAPFDFTPGKDLVDYLIVAKKKADSPSGVRRRLRNIWEDWGTNESQTPVKTEQAHPETPTAGTAQPAGAHTPHVVPDHRAEDFPDPYLEEHEEHDEHEDPLDRPMDPSKILRNIWE